MPKQILEFVDYLSPLAVGGCFAITLFIVCIVFINWCCIQETDDITVFEEWGYKKNMKMKLGVHRKSVVAHQVRLTQGFRDIE